MILLIYDYLANTLGMKVPTVFAYYSTRMILAVLTSLLLSIFLGSFFIRMLYALKVGQTVRSEDYGLIGKLHANKKDTPTMGGVLILFSMLVSLLLWMDLTHPFTLLLFLTTVILGAAGGWDDYIKIRYKNVRGLSGTKKLLIQALVSAMVAAYLFIPQVSQGLHHGRWFEPPIIKEQIYQARIEIGSLERSKAPGSDRKSVPVSTINRLAIDHPRVLSHGARSLVHGKGYEANESRELTLREYASLLYVPFVKGPFLSFTGIFTVIAVLLVFFVIAGCSNGVNLTDGLDGLAAGCLLMVASTLAIFAFLSNNIEIARYLNILYVEGSGEIAIYLCAFAGACLGFLWYNGFPAQVFMGDIGSLTLGGILGVSTVLLKRELLLGIVGGIFVIEALSVILQVGSYRLRNKKRIFLCAPLHHHFEYKGWPETKVVIRFWIIGLLLALIGIASLKFQ